MCLQKINASEGAQETICGSQPGQNMVVRPGQARRPEPPKPVMAAAVAELGGSTELQGDPRLGTRRTTLERGCERSRPTHGFDASIGVRGCAQDARPGARVGASRAPRTRTPRALGLTPRAPLTGPAPSGRGSARQARASSGGRVLGGRSAASASGPGGELGRTRPWGRGAAAQHLRPPTPPPPGEPRAPRPAQPALPVSRSPRWGRGPGPARRPACARGRGGDVSAASEAARAAVTSAEPRAARARAPASAARGGGGRAGPRRAHPRARGALCRHSRGLQPSRARSARRLAGVDRTPPGMRVPGRLHLLHRSVPRPVPPLCFFFLGLFVTS